MKIEKIYTGCLAQVAYYVESDGEAAIIDPWGQVQPYLRKADKSGSNIRYIFETQIQAGRMPDHLDLAQKSGASLVSGPTSMKLGLEGIVARDGQEFNIGKSRIRVIHTPAHALEGAVYLLIDEKGREVALFTGSILPIGDVGWSDMVHKIKDGSPQEKVVGLLYDFLRKKIMPLSDEVTVYAAPETIHACSKNLSKETSDTLAHLKMTHFALQDISKKEFIKKVIPDLSPATSNLPKNDRSAIKEYEWMDKLPERVKVALNPVEFEWAANNTGAILLDTRDPRLFAKGHVPNSINISIDGSFAVWVGTLIGDVKQKLLFISEEGREEEVMTRLAKIGYHQALGFLKGGIKSWINEEKEIDTVSSISMEDLLKIQGKQGNIQVLDVRSKSEFGTEHVKGAKNFPLEYINDYMGLILKDQTYYVHSADRFRSMIFISILKSRGYRKLVDILGGFNSIKLSGKFEITDYICPTTLLG